MVSATSLVRSNTALPETLRIPGDSAYRPVLTRDRSSASRSEARHDRRRLAADHQQRLGHAEREQRRPFG